MVQILKLGVFFSELAQVLDALLLQYLEGSNVLHDGHQALAAPLHDPGRRKRDAQMAMFPLIRTHAGVDLAARPYRSRLAELRRRGLGLWDVYASCRREGSLDQAIEDAEFNDLASLRRRAPGLRLVAHNGGESARAMRRIRELGLPVQRLPSSSPANASWSFERKLDAWRAVFRDAGV